MRLERENKFGKTEIRPMEKKNYYESSGLSQPKLNENEFAIVKSRS